MTPTDFVAAIAATLLSLFVAGFIVLICWMVWEMTEPARVFLLHHWRAWRGRDDDDSWHA